MGALSSSMLMYMKKKVSAITLAKAHLQKKNKMTSHLFLLLYQAQSYTLFYMWWMDIQQDSRNFQLSGYQHI